MGWLWKHMGQFRHMRLEQMTTWACWAERLVSRSMTTLNYQLSRRHVVPWYRLVLVYSMETGSAGNRVHHNQSTHTSSILFQFKLSNQIGLYLHMTINPQTHPSLWRGKKPKYPVLTRAVAGRTRTLHADSTRRPGPNRKLLALWVSNSASFVTVPLSSAQLFIPLLYHDTAWPPSLLRAGMFYAIGDNTEI